MEGEKCYNADVPSWMVEFVLIELGKSEHIRAGCKITSCGGDLKDSATEIYRHFIDDFCVFYDIIISYLLFFHKSYVSGKDGKVG